jgi:DNA polymerase-1
MSDSRLIIVDGLSVLYRSFFAIRELSTAEGRPTNAVFGFVRTIHQLRQQRKPTHLTVVFDGGLPEERTRLLPEYKAQRPRMPDALREQVEVVRDYLDRANTPWVLHDGYEADDIMSSMVAQWAGAYDEAVLVTSDKDLFQMAGDRVRIAAVAGKAGDMGSREVEEKTGVKPAQIPGWLALVGDSSDNIPGVPGIGPKTAAGLLRQFGSLDAMWDRLDEVDSPRVRDRLREHRDVVIRNLSIVTLRTDLDLGVGWGDVALVDPDRDRLIALFESLEFDGMLRDLREPDLFAG